MGVWGRSLAGGQCSPLAPSPNPFFQKIRGQGVAVAGEEGFRVELDPVEGKGRCWRPMMTPSSVQAVTSSSGELGTAMRE